MIKTKKILIALAVIGANVLHNMPVHTALAEADYTIKQGGVIGNSGTSGNYTITIQGNTDDTGLTVTGGSLSATSYSGNEVIIHSGVYAPEGTSGNNAVAGAYNNNTTSDALSNNTVNIYDGTFKGDLFGANSTKGVVSGNKVNIYDGTLGVSPTAINIYGGLSNTEDATGNLTNIEGGAFASGAYIRGGGSYSGNATGNILSIKGVTFTATDTIKNYFYGGESNNGNVTGNTLSIEDGTFSGTNNYFYGGHSANGTVGGDTAESGNKVIVNNSFFDGSIYGGKSDNVTAKNNLVIINKGTFATVYGGEGKGGAEKNTVTINDGTFSGYVYGGNSDNGLATGNKVTIKGGNFSGQTIGAAWSKNGIAKNNNMTISGGTFSHDSQYIYGGLGKNGATGNKVIITDGTFSGTATRIYGGWSNSGGAADNNIVEISGGTFGNGYSLYGGNTTGTSTNNTLNLKTVIGGTASEVKYFQIMNFTLPNDITDGDVMLSTSNLAVGSSDGAVINVYADEVEFSKNDSITLVQADNDIAGSYTVGKIFDVDAVAVSSGGVYSTDIAKITIGSNSITLTMLRDCITSDSWYGTATGEFVRKKTEAVPAGGILNIAGTEDSFTETKYFYGGYSKDDGVEVEGNTVTVTGGTFKSGSEIYGGYSEGAGSVSGNTITIKGGNFEAGTSGTATIIFGGRSNGGVANDNIVNIEGGDFGEYCYFYGGNAAPGGTANNNILNVTGGTFKDNFAFYGGWASSFGGNVLNLKTKINSRAFQVASFNTMNFTLPVEIANGDTMLKTTYMSFDTTNKTTINVYAANGVMLKKDDVITLIDSTNAFGAEDYTKGTILDGAAELVNKEDQNKILQIVLLKDFEQKASGDEDKQKAPVEGIAAAVQTVNMSADLASGEGMRSLILETVGGFTNTFGALTAGHSKYKTGSHVDVDGWGVVVGAGKTKEWGNGEATSLGVFLEYGKGNFDTYNGSIHGDGNSENKGIGFMMRHKMLNNTYYEGNIRYGKVETDWSESEVGGYNTDSKYYGISVGMGHIFPAGKNEIDVYGRYTYGHVGSSDARVGTKDYHFDSVKSHRVRIGGKYNFKQENSNAKPFVGLAWEHEFKGESKASIAGVGEAPAPGMKGNTGIMEVGCDWNLGKKWTAGISADAYVGKRKGWDGMARIFYNF